jgi:hypothetical protein
MKTDYLKNLKEKLEIIENDIFEMKASAEKEEGESRIELKTIEVVMSSENELEGKLNEKLDEKGRKNIEKKIDELQGTVRNLKEKSRKHQ